MEGLLAIVFFLQNSLLLMGAELPKFSLEPFALFPPLILGICWIPLFKPERVEYLISNMNRLHYEDKHQDAAQVADAATIKIRDRLEELLDEQRIYTEPSLTLAETADMLSIPVYQLSQTINKGYDCNFLTLINRKRVEEMKNRLLETGDSVLEVGLEAGFNSKSTINLAFKKETGMTPSQFRKENSHEAG
jgi:AraC-like DNA-binding protein